jgi:hypothetical protein
MDRSSAILPMDAIKFAHPLAIGSKPFIEALLEVANPARRTMDCEVARIESIQGGNRASCRIGRWTRYIAIFQACISSRFFALSTVQHMTSMIGDRAYRPACRIPSTRSAEEPMIWSAKSPRTRPHCHTRRVYGRVPSSRSGMHSVGLYALAMAEGTFG